MHLAVSVCAAAVASDVVVLSFRWTRETLELATIPRQISETRRVLATLGDRASTKGEADRTGALQKLDTRLKNIDKGWSDVVQAERRNTFIEVLHAVGISREERCQAIQWLSDAWESIGEYGGQTEEVQRRRKRIVNLEQYTRSWNKGGRFKRVQWFAGKAIFFLLVPQLVLYMNAYATYRGFVSEGHRPQSRLSGPFYLWVRKFAALSVQQLSRPSPLLFFGATMSWTMLNIWYFQANTSDKYQLHALLAALGIGLLLGQQENLDLLASCLCVIPWCIYWSLVLSDFAHYAVRKIRAAVSCGLSPCQ